ncbi:MAG TPA: bifunctional 4-hydroxy-2-oxoglutarate aldolase/2-dehydro-3-deoxy-phosphogluconate aldolase [Solirubrobacteraceae bacterium]|nr:bifunctional 4-hydroxy-2-oxoglutarate aldolase/2-dehydro-3-deoxy-phosphogluconate aldolase [Solirubrobacteraceae bacterium]
MSFQALLGATRVVPVITIEDADTAVPLAEALVAGGLQVLEITLRTDAGLESIRRIAAEVPGAVVGAGTVTTPQQLLDARNAGARFIVSPGCTDSLARAAADAGGVFLPGAVTASEVLGLLEHGISMMKFFPAESSGGIAALKALGAPFPQVSFCPTGGIGLAAAPDYLALPNVVCIGGSWMAPADLIAHHEWAAVTALAAEATSATRRSAAAVA